MGDDNEVDAAAEAAEQQQLLLLNSCLMSNSNDDDIFVTDDERRRAAEEKRRLRRQRLRTMAEEAEKPRERTNKDRGDGEDAGAKQRKQNDVVSSPATAGTTTEVKLDRTKSPKVAAAASADTTAGNSATDDNTGGNDSFDMFSSAPIVSHQQATTAAAATTTTTTTTANGGDARGHEQQDWDDDEGYYKAVLGEIIHLQPPPPPESNNKSNSNNNNNSISLRVSGVIGKGVFSTVLKCTTVSNSSSVTLPPVTALKFIRHNDTMAKAALTELEMLQRINGSPGIVPLLLPTTTTPLEHRGHVIFVFAHMEYNLRDVLQKFGKGVGLSLPAVRSYFGQLLAAATHLQKHGMVHADLKLDNVLVNADFSHVQLADFGSAMDVNDLAASTSSSAAPPTPYLVSRYYRAPEIILGLPPTHAIDLWSLAVTVAELFLGNVLFRGTSNNDMLYVFMQHLGAVPNRVIRQHLVQCQRFVLPHHFVQQGASYCFTQQTCDPVTGMAVHKVLSLLVSSSTSSATQPHNGSSTPTFPLATPLHKKLMKAKSAKDSRLMVQQFSNLLKECLVLDPSRRIDLKEALRHEFFQTTATATTTTSAS